MATAMAIVRKHDRECRVCHHNKDLGKVSSVTNEFCKERGSSTAKMTVENFDTKKQQFLFDITTVVEMVEIPPQVVFNWDQTAISIVLRSSRTMELKGS